MKLVKSLALGSAAALVAMSGAKAADLPGAEPVEYVKVCDAYGAGFFYIPGSDTCLQIGGFARLDLSAGEVTKYNGNVSAANQGLKPSNNVGYRTRARIWFDARTETEYGTVRTYIRAQFQRQSGATGAAAATDTGTGDDSIFDKAFVQFAGLTAGLTDSFWDFKPYPTFMNPFISDRTLSVLAYTADFGGGFSASVAIEDGTARRATGLTGVNVTAANGGFLVAPYQEQKYPDIVGNVRIQQGWGEAQISGFAHNITSNSPLQAAGATATTGSAFRDTSWGFGGQVGAKIKLDAIAKGDFVYGTAAYSSGALSYLGMGNGSSDFNFGIAQTQNIAAYNRAVDFEVGADGSIKKTTAYAFNLGVLHYWDPKWRSALQGTYIKANVKTPGVDNDFSSGAVTGNLIWSPIKKLDIGGEVTYAKVFNKSETYTLRNSDEWIGRLRVQRDF